MRNALPRTVMLNEKNLVPPVSELRRRLRRLREELRRRKLSAFYVTHPANVRYLSGCTNDESSLLVTCRSCKLITDGRYGEECEGLPAVTNVVLRKGPAEDEVARQAVRLPLSTLGVEATRFSVASHQKLKVKLAHPKRARRIRLVNTTGIMENLRLLKSEWEVERIRAALGVAEEVGKEVFKTFGPGLTEAQMAAEIVCRLRKQGAREAFEPIVAVGANASKPHARPGSRKLKPTGTDSFFLCDWGACVCFYNSDLTRCLWKTRIQGTGKTTRRKSGRRPFDDLYELVREAQRAAVELIRPGIKIAEVASAARKVISDAGYGSFFTHGLGHGLGLEVHEQPAVSCRAKGRLKAGMVFTVEPGIYLPGTGGVRVEDDVLVTKGGVEVLSRIPACMERSAE